LNLQPALRKSASTRVVAVGFIVTILGGNFWLSFWFFGNVAPVFLTYFIQSGIVLVFFGGIGMGVQSIFLRTKPSAGVEGEADAESESVD
jgi:ribose/xylose/arabinose/galactoside ABC-type transport system permease subunit